MSLPSFLVHGHLWSTSASALEFVEVHSPAQRGAGRDAGIYSQHRCLFQVVGTLFVVQPVADVIENGLVDGVPEVVARPALLEDVDERVGLDGGVGDCLVADVGTRPVFAPVGCPSLGVRAFAAAHFLARAT